MNSLQYFNVIGDTVMLLHDFGLKYARSTKSTLQRHKKTKRNWKYVGKASAISQPTRSAQPSMPPGSVN